MITNHCYGRGHQPKQLPPSNHQETTKFKNLTQERKRAADASSSKASIWDDMVRKERKNLPIETTETAPTRARASSFFGRHFSCLAGRHGRVSRKTQDIGNTHSIPPPGSSKSVRLMDHLSYLSLRMCMCVRVSFSRSSRRVGLFLC